VACEAFAEQDGRVTLAQYFNGTLFREMLPSLTKFAFLHYFSPMDEQQAPTVDLIAKYRWIENGHIYLWLIKDTCWAFEFKAGGIFMILPTVSVAIFLLWRSRHALTEFIHNIAVCIWLFANSIWMIGEFFEKDTRNYAIILFAIGLLILTVYYMYSFLQKNKSKT
jgi:hypothetical protein